MSKRYSSVNALINDLRRDRSNAKYISLAVVFFLLFWCLAGVAVWPFIFQVVDTIQVESSWMTGARWIAPGTALLNLMVALAIPERMYRFSASAAGIYIMDYIVFGLILANSPIAMFAGIERGGCTMLMQFLLNFILSGWLAVLPAAVGAGVGWLIRMMWITVVRGGMCGD